MTLSESQPTRRGSLIVVEGLDRAGKSSQCELLRDQLLTQGHAVEYIRFPGAYLYVDNSLQEETESL